MHGGLALHHIRKARLDRFHRACAGNIKDQIHRVWMRPKKHALAKIDSYLLQRPVDTGTDQLPRRLINLEKPPYRSIAAVELPVCEGIRQHRKLLHAVAQGLLDMQGANTRIRGEADDTCASHGACRNSDEFRPHLLDE